MDGIGCGVFPFIGVALRSIYGGGIVALGGIVSAALRARRVAKARIALRATNSGGGKKISQRLPTLHAIPKSEPMFRGDALLPLGRYVSSGVFSSL